MDTRNDESFPRTPIALGIITTIVYIAGFAMVAAWLALVLLEQPRASSAPRAVAACGICGTVDAVREIQPAPGQALEGSRAEGAVILLAALGGAAARGAGAARIYETSVIHDDGAVRVLRDTGAPQWQRGDRVRVIKGRVEPDPKAAATLAPATAAPAASQPGRTPSPAPQAARAP